MPTKTTTYTTVAGLNKALAKLPKEASAELRTASKAIASDIAQEAQGRARGQGGVAALVAPTIKAYRDRVPTIRMGGTKKLPTEGAGWERTRDGDKQTIGDVIWGAEFGGRARSTTMQFLPHKGTVGYFLWPTVRDRSDDMQERYSKALDDALESIR
jgi:hypothetical protein